MVARWIGLIAALLVSLPTFSQVQFRDVKDALASLQAASFDQRWHAMKYLAAVPDESIPLLLPLIERKEPGWQLALTAVARSKDSRALPFLSRELADNFFLKEADGTRKIFGLGSKNGCLVMPNDYGSALAKALGELGDPLAIPVLREAISQGDRALQRSAYEALYRVGGASLDDLLALPDEVQVDLTDVVDAIGWRAMESDPKFALSVFDRIISRFANDPWRVAGAHFWKMKVFESSRNYDAAKHEADEVQKFEQYADLIRQAREAQARYRAKDSAH